MSRQHWKCLRRRWADEILIVRGAEHLRRVCQGLAQTHPVGYAISAQLAVKLIVLIQRGASAPSLDAPYP